MFETIVQRRLRVPYVDAPLGDGSVVARQMDAVLLQAGFTASRELMYRVSGTEPGAAIDLAAHVISAVRDLVGDHVQHNAYFIDFPNNVPDTIEFWVSCLRAALVPAGVPAADEVFDAGMLCSVAASGVLNLLSLPTYGRYQHSYADLVAAHDELVATAGDRITVLHAGDSLEEETRALYLELAGSTTPLNEADQELLLRLAYRCLEGAQPDRIPVRENRALLNKVRLPIGHSLVGIDTVTDVLRLAASASEGDVSLQEPPRFRSFARRERRAMLSALDRVLADSPYKLADVLRHTEAWKRLGEGLHPHEYTDRYPHAQKVFAVARGELVTKSLASVVESGLKAHDEVGVARLLAEQAPGMLVRSLDRLLRNAMPIEADAIITAARPAFERASGRVLLSLREHLMNRAAPQAARVFVGRSKRAWVADDVRPTLSPSVLDYVGSALDVEIANRLPEIEYLVLDQAVMGVALPLSGRATESGFAVLPRGSRLALDPTQGSLRFFCYWRQTERRTDFDLSALMLDEDFQHAGQVSYTNLRSGDVVHSGDITSAPDGATEFIEVPLQKVPDRVKYVVPQVNIYSGEGFNEVAESMFGYMLRDRSAKGMPFEPRTVRTRSEMRGAGRVALPVMFERGKDGEWSAVWTHLYLSGMPNFNRVEANRLSTALLARSIVERRYFTVGDLLELAVRRKRVRTVHGFGALPDRPVTYIGLERPDGLPEGSEFFGPDRLAALIPG